MRYKKGDKIYIIFDSRYHADPERAAVMECCDTLEEAKKNRSDYGEGCVIVENEFVDDGKHAEETGKTY